MFIQDMLDNRHNKTYDKGVNDAIDIFDRQSDALKGIKDTSGMIVLLEYVDTVIESAEQRLDKGYDENVFAEMRAHKNLRKFFRSRVES
tara:strand:- start:142 stop:408 length:267 start_codon:yes stop_codon:yes gene_type:complete